MKIDRLSALDRLMLWASRRWPQDIGSIAILDGSTLVDADGRFRIETVREVIGQRLDQVPRFRQLIYTPRRGLGGPLWVDAPTFDLTRHVRELALEPPAGEETLLRAVEQLIGQRLDPSRPLWEMWFLAGLPDHRVGLFVKIHHSIGDGMAALMTMATFMDAAPDVPVETPNKPWKPSPPPPAWALLTDNLGTHLGSLTHLLGLLLRPRTTLRKVRAAWPAIRELIAEEPATETSLDRVVGPARRIALIRTDFAAVRHVGRLEHATVNDVLLAATAGGLRELLRTRGEPVAKTTLRMYVPVSLRHRLRGVGQGNVIAQMAVPMRLGDTDARLRLRRIAADTQARKARTRTNMSALLIGGSIGRRLMLAAVMRQRVNMTSASIPGPTRRRYLAGARVLEIFPVLPLVANEPLGVGGLSYAGALGIGITADRDAYPDIELLAAAMRDALAALGVQSAIEPEHRAARPKPPLRCRRKERSRPALIRASG